MKITECYIDDKKAFMERNIVVPNYNATTLKTETEKHPRWIHFGGGNLYRCFHAKIAQDLLNENLMDSGIVLVESFGKELIEQVYHPNDNKSLSVVMMADGSFTRELIASTTHASFLNKSNLQDLKFLQNVFENDSLQFVTLTITEKGYVVKDIAGNLLPYIQEDIQAGADIAKLNSTLAQLAYFLYCRFQKGGKGIALLSTDNFSHNGDRLKESLQVIIRGWVENKSVPQAFYSYIFESKKVSFPYSMIDRITPGPSQAIADKLQADDIEGMNIIKLERGAPIAAFVNTEEIYYWAIEDDFPNGRPPLEKAFGVFMADRETVNKTDLMKVTTCLNPLHTALAVNGCLLGYTSIYDETKNADLLKLIEKIGYEEGLPVVEDPKIINPKQFIDEVIYKRFMNPNIPDMPQRIATDTSQKLAIRFGETIKSYMKSSTLDTKSLVFIPYVIASWCRYLMAIDDAGKAFTPSPDPLYNVLYPNVKDIKLGDKIDVHKHLQPILSNKQIFGVDLYEAGIAEKVEEIFVMLIQKEGAVATTLHKLLNA